MLVHWTLKGFCPSVNSGHHGGGLTWWKAKAKTTTTSSFFPFRPDYKFLLPFPSACREFQSVPHTLSMPAPSTASSQRSLYLAEGDSPTPTSCVLLSMFSIKSFFLSFCFSIAPENPNRIHAIEDRGETFPALPVPGWLIGGPWDQNPPVSSAQSLTGATKTQVSGGLCVSLAQHGSWCPHRPLLTCLCFENTSRHTSA